MFHVTVCATLRVTVRVMGRVMDRQCARVLECRWHRSWIVKGRWFVCIFKRTVVARYLETKPEPNLTFHFVSSGSA